MYIDFVVVLILTTFIMQIVTFGKLEQLESPLIISLVMIIYFILILFLFLRKDLLFKNASIGKKTMKIAIYKEDGTIPNKDILIKRISSHLLFFPLELLYIALKNKSSGDKEYETIVTVKK